MKSNVAFEFELAPWTYHSCDAEDVARCKEYNGRMLWKHCPKLCKWYRECQQKTLMGKSSYHFFYWTIFGVLWICCRWGSYYVRVQFLEQTDARWRRTSYRPPKSTFRKRRNLHAVGKANTHSKNSYCAVSTGTPMPFVVFTEDGTRSLRTGVLRDVVTSKATRGNPAGVRTNCNSDRYPAHVQCVEFISTKSKSSLFQLNPILCRYWQ